MDTIPSLDNWLAQTKLGAMKPRSDEMKAIDDALRKYNVSAPANKESARKDLSAAFARWIGKEGYNWRNSERNKNGAVERLYNALNETNFSDADLQAFEWQDEQRKERLKRIFKTIKIVKRKSLIADRIYDRRAAQIDAATGTMSRLWARLHGWSKWQWCSTQWEKIKSNISKTNNKASSGGGGTIALATNQYAGKLIDPEAVKLKASVLELFTKNICPSDLPAHEFETIVLETLGNSLDAVVSLFVEAIPIVTQGISGYQMLDSWKRLAKAMWLEDSVVDASNYVIPDGDVRAAFAGLEQILNDLTMRAARTSARLTVTFSAKCVSVFLDGGTASSLAISGVGLLAFMLDKVCVTVKEEMATSDAREMLLSQEFTPELFSKFPLLGCYMLLLLDTSDILNMVRTENMRNGAVKFGSLGWKEEVVWIKRNHLDSILAAAAQVVAASDYVLQNEYTGEYLFETESGTRLTNWRSLYKEHEYKSKDEDKSFYAAYKNDKAVAVHKPKIDLSKIKAVAVKKDESVQPKSE